MPVKKLVKQTARQPKALPKPKFKHGQAVKMVGNADWTGTVSNWPGAISWDDYGHFYRYKVQQDGVDASGYRIGRHLWINEDSLAPRRARPTRRPAPTGFGSHRRSNGEGDPYWMKVRFEAPCRGCGRLIHRGAQGYYFPNGRALYCDADSCGGHQARMFEAAKADERFVGGDVDY